MMKTTRRFAMGSVRGMFAVALPLIMMLGTPAGVSADETDATRLLKAMTDYMAAQKALSFEYDATLEVVTQDDQKLALASSGTLVLERPGKLRATRVGGFADVVMIFDGKTLTLLGRNQNVYAQKEVPGSVDHLIDELQVTYNRPLPAADLLLSNAYDELMQDVTEVMDLGSGVIGGVECDHLAFRAEEVDWQIWIAQGKAPYPCRYTITSKLIVGAPEYTIQVRNWKAGDAVAAGDFSFVNTTEASKVELNALEGQGDLPEHFKTGEAK